MGSRKSISTPTHALDCSKLLVRRRIHVLLLVFALQQYSRCKQHARTHAGERASEQASTIRYLASLPGMPCRAGRDELRATQPRTMATAGRTRMGGRATLLSPSSHQGARRSATTTTTSCPWQDHRSSRKQLPVPHFAICAKLFKCSKIVGLALIPESAFACCCWLREEWQWQWRWEWRSGSRNAIAKRERLTSLRSGEGVSVGQYVQQPRDGREGEAERKKCKRCRVV